MVSLNCYFTIPNTNNPSPYNLVKHSRVPKEHVSVYDTIGSAIGETTEVTHADQAINSDISRSGRLVNNLNYNLK